MSLTNHTILDAIHLSASNDYQQRAPIAGSFQNVEDGVKAVVDFLTEPLNGRYFNEFQDSLIALIGTQRINSHEWTNPLAFVKTADFVNGKGVQEFGFPYIEAIAYDDNATNFLEQHKISPRSAFYGVNRRDVYPISVNQEMLRQSFLDGSGLDSFLAGILSIPMASSEYDELRIMMATFSAANQKNPFYNVQQVFANPAQPTEAEMKQFSISIRKLAMQFAVVPSGLYNGYGLPTVTKQEDLIFITTPDMIASLDVNVIASAFNASAAEIKPRIVLVDELPWAGAYGILADRNAIVAGDSLRTVEMFRNPRSLVTNYYLHIQGGYAISPFKNVAVISSSASTNIGVVDVELDSITSEAVLGDRIVSTVKPGTSNVNVWTIATGTITGDTKGLFKVPDAVTYAVSTTGYQTSRLFVDRLGRVHVPADAEIGDVITITVTSAYIDPSAPVGTPTVAVTDTVTLTVASSVTFTGETVEERVAALELEVAGLDDRVTVLEGP